MEITKTNIDERWCSLGCIECTKEKKKITRKKNVWSNLEQKSYTAKINSCFYLHKNWRQKPVFV